MDAAGRTGAGDGDGGGGRGRSGGGGGGGGGSGGGGRGGGAAGTAKPAGWRARYAGRLLACRMGGCPEGHCDTRSRIMHDRILSMRRERERCSAVGTENEVEDEEDEEEEEEEEEVEVESMCVRANVRTERSPGTSSNAMLQS
uniref:Uncharacterized protein n=1 Tax=Vespula pensylvanica TaxID=30213 RepID=A0A834NKJ8_VESPE|nr:hypothetical protein H0235_012698 [Vespula pensylvanica]